VNLTLKVWRQNGPADEGHFETYDTQGINDDMSFLEMLDVVNEGLISQDRDPIAFDHDCREGICGSCGMVINGQAHGPRKLTTACQLHMRLFKDGDTIVVEPWRARAFPILKDLVVDRGPLDRIIEAGGYITAPTGSARDANITLVPKSAADQAFDAAACIGCGACVAACPNGAAQLFTAAKISHLNLLPQGQPERWSRTVAMVETMEEYFGSCTNYTECEAVCPKGISVDVIAKMNRDYLKAKFKDRRSVDRGGMEEAGG
jgi:succinate dehydrogenase / fumarate reductase, iron-sulfur subunit